MIRKPLLDFGKRPNPGERNVVLLEQKLKAFFLHTLPCSEKIHHEKIHHEKISHRKRNLWFRNSKRRRNPNRKLHQSAFFGLATDAQILRSGAGGQAALLFQGHKYFSVFVNGKHKGTKGTGEFAVGRQIL